MFRSSCFSAAAALLLVASLSAQAIGADLSAQDATSIENSARRIGETVIDQGHSAADVRKIVTFYVQGEVAKALHSDMPEAPLTPDESAQVKQIADKVMSSLHVSEPVDPKPAPTPPVRPAGPVAPPFTPPSPPPAPGPGPQPGNQPGPQPVFVWVVNPAVQPATAPVAWPAAVPVAPAVGAFVPLPGWPGGAPTIHIKHGWFGHPDKVWYSRH